jgi:hypothetical protein
MSSQPSSPPAQHTAATFYPDSCQPNLTRHASVRAQQRGIPVWFLALLVDHGRSHHDWHGAVVKSVDRAMRRRPQGVLSRADYIAAETYFDVYAVVANDDLSIVTTAHRTRRRHLH